MAKPMVPAANSASQPHCAAASTSHNPDDVPALQQLSDQQTSTNTVPTLLSTGSRCQDMSAAAFELIRLETVSTVRVTTLTVSGRFRLIRRHS
ncbi:hypothetical protein PoB_003423500 [Plakobranchus ocellatus]|uniref:Uncharacterized protein n=1 Tax=Plakobranchus ocellatus TaxID=259542 RepID=A0AAV4AK65_9GAST|nr:hypothetical protein PoB_003423500 [Plakobranchus ocellatus]